MWEFSVIKSLYIEDIPKDIANSYVYTKDFSYQGSEYEFYAPHPIQYYPPKSYNPTNIPTAKPGLQWGRTIFNSGSTPISVPKNINHPNREDIRTAYFHEESIEDEQDTFLRAFNKGR